MKDHVFVFLGLLPDHRTSLLLNLVIVFVCVRLSGALRLIWVRWVAAPGEVCSLPDPIPRSAGPRCYNYIVIRTGMILLFRVGHRSLLLSGDGCDGGGSGHFRLPASFPNFSFLAVTIPSRPVMKSQQALCQLERGWRYWSHTKRS